MSLSVARLSFVRLDLGTYWTVLAETWCTLSLWAKLLFHQVSAQTAQWVLSLGSKGIFASFQKMSLKMNIFETEKMQILMIFREVRNGLASVSGTRRHLDLI